METREFRTLLITGGAGFIGSNFIHYMMNKYPDYKIINLDKLTYAGNLENLDEIKVRIMHLWTLGIQDYLGRIDPECAERMVQTFPRLLPEEVITCAKLLLDEYERICPAYCRKAGIAYPAHKVAVIRHLVAEFEQLT